MTEAQIVAAIQNYVTSNEGVTNFALREEQIADEVDTLRSRMLIQLNSRNQLHKPFLGWTQTFETEILKEAGTQALYIKIPRLFIMSDGNPAIAYIGGTDGDSPYRVVTGNHGAWTEHDEFVAKRPLAVYSEEKFKIKHIAPKTVLVVGVFFKPRLVPNYDPGYDDSPDDINGSQYPAPDGIIDEMIGKTAESYLRVRGTQNTQPNNQSDIPQMQRGQQ